MSSICLYQIIAKVYDILDVTYFRNKDNSPRTAVLSRIQWNERILDLCTGTATNAINIASRRPGTEITGIDLSDKMLEVGRSKVSKKRISNVALERMDATDLSYGAGTFDVVLISLVLHELEDDLAGRLIREAKRVLKEDGRIIVTEWERPRKASQKVLFAPVAILEPKPYRSFIRKDMYRYFEEYGLKVEEYIHCDYSRVLVLKKEEQNETPSDMRYLEQTKMLDDKYLASLQNKFASCTGAFCEYGVGVEDFRDPKVEWDGEDTYIQKTGINQDFGVYNNPDDMLLEHHQQIGVLKRFTYRYLGRHLMNRNIRKVRERG